MGPNSRRAQQKAQESRNVPSRARFSKLPPKKNTRGGRNSNNGGRKSNDGRGGRSGRGRGGRGGGRTHSAAVIDKLARRVEDKSRRAASSSTNITGTTKRHPLDSVDISRLDEVTLSQESVDLVTRLLQDLKVMESPQSWNDSDEEESDSNSAVDENGEDEDLGDSLPDEPLDFQRSSGGYAEYEDDVEEEYPDEEEDNLNGRVDLGGHVSQDDDDVAHSDDKAPETDNDLIRQSPLFLYLAKQLSFSAEHAQRACVAIESWEILDKREPSTSGSGNSLDSDQLGLAMDWLCLHLSDSELSAGFKPNSQGLKRTSSAVSSTGMLLAGTGRTKPIPHSSISVARPITSDGEWRETLRRQSRKVGFLRLGFHHEEAEKACMATMDVSEKLATEEDEDGLRVLLSLLEKDILGEDHKVNDTKNPVDLEFAQSEREQEVQALEAIYDDLFTAVGDVGNGKGRYIISVTPVEDLREPARTEECKLHVFVRPGYPVLNAPLLLFTNPTLPPTVLRRVNEEMIRLANQNIGEATVFTVVDAISNSLSDTQKDFIKEQRTKEMEAEQLRLRKAAGHNVDIDTVIEAQYENDGNIGRRQRARLKAAEKSFGCAEQVQKAEAQRQALQKERLERINQQNKSIRQTYAERAVEERARERVKEEAERAARAAMNDAFLRGEDRDSARVAAKKARKRVLCEHGEEVSLSDDGGNDASDDAGDVCLDENESTESDADESPVVVSNGTVSQPETRKHVTPTTAAFMERLRAFYNDAALAKARGDEAVQIVSDRTTNEDASDTTTRLHLAEPKDARDRQTHNSVGVTSQNPTHVPNPVPIPTGDLADVMKDVIKGQNEQPWLISPEARAPVVTESKPLSPEQIRQRDSISKRLRDELRQKMRIGEEWGAKNSSKGQSNGKTGSKAQRVHAMMSQRKRLPAFEMREDIVQTIASNQVTVVCGDTGCGKTTQVPQLVLDSMIMEGKGAEANMVVTQPRRISAIGVSDRIADERCERIGETVGYSIRMENKRSAKTRLLLCTTGILLRRLQCDPDLASVSHIFLDEVHERDLNTDFLLIILKGLLSRRRELKLILMSATLNAETFAQYFGEGTPTVSIPGRTFPVKENRLEDILQLTGYEVKEGSDFALKTSKSRPGGFSKSTLRKMYYPEYTSSVISSLAIVDETVINYELLAELVEHITLNNDEGAILVFMPGMMEITKTIDELRKKPIFQDSLKTVIYPLHSSLSSAEQSAIFAIPPQGIRKVVVATNIAETSITIEDVVFVVDSGRVKENQRDESNEMPTLVETWVSRASAKQRRGRAGRVRPGIAYHMFSSHRYERDLQEYQLPEMLRVGLEDLILQILLLDLGEPSSFLGKAVNPPSALSLKNSLKLLEGLGAVEVEWGDTTTGPYRGLSGQRTEKDDEGSPSCGTVTAESGLTALGFHIAALPVSPKVGKMMIYGALFQCIDPALTIAASMSARSPFVSPFDKRDAADAARQEFATENSDHLTTLNAFNTWKNTRRMKGDKSAARLCSDSFLSRLTLFQMEDLRRQFSDLLVDIGFLPRKFRQSRGRGPSENNSSANANSENVALVKAVLCAGLYPNIIVAPRSLARKDGGLSDKSAGECAFQSLKGEVYLHPCTVSFSEKRLGSRYSCYNEIVRTSKTYVRDSTTVSEFALMLFGGNLKVYHTHGVVTIDDWLKFRIDAKAATLVKHLRAQMETVLLKKILSPEEDITGSKEGKALIQAVSALLEKESARPDDHSGADIVRPWIADSNQGGRSGRRSQQGGRGQSGRGRNSNSRNTGRGRSGRGRY